MRKDHLTLCLVARKIIRRNYFAFPFAQGMQTSFTVAHHIIKVVMFSNLKQCDVISHHGRELRSRTNFHSFLRRKNRG